MTKRQKTFGTKKVDAQTDTTDVSFTLGDNTYFCKEQIQGSTILNFISASDEGGAKAAAEIIPFISKSLLEHERERFLGQIESENEIVEMETLSEIVAFLVESYTSERPTQESEFSDAGS